MERQEGFLEGDLADGRELGNGPARENNSVMKRGTILALWSAVLLFAPIAFHAQPVPNHPDLQVSGVCTAPAAAAIRSSRRLPPVRWFLKPEYCEAI